VRTDAEGTGEDDVKRGTPEHPKVAHLQQLLRTKKYAAVGVLELLWHFTARFAPRGDIGKFSDDQIAAAVDWGGSPARLIESLTISKLVDESPESRLYVHDWHDHSDDAADKWLARNGLTYANGAQPRNKKSRQNSPLATVSGNVQTSPEKYGLSYSYTEPEPHSHGAGGDAVHSILAEVFPGLSYEDDLVARRCAPAADFAVLARECVKVAVNEVGGIRNPFTFWRAFVIKSAGAGEKNKDAAPVDDNPNGRVIRRRA
jgi:hypothetical protein